MGSSPFSAALHKRGWMSDVWKSGRECGPRAAEDHNFTWQERERGGIADKPSRDGVCAADKRDGGKVSSGILTVGRVGALGELQSCSVRMLPRRLHQ